MCLLLVPFLVRATPMESPSRSILETVTVREYHDRHERSGLELSFPSLGPDPKLVTLTVEEARALVVSLEKEFDAPKPRRKPSTLATWSLGTVATGLPVTALTGSELMGLERRVRAEYLKFYGSPMQGFPLPDNLESARWFQALKLSPRYMGEGVHDAAVELFSSPTFSLSVGFSLMLYGLAWAAPEPLFSKAFAAAVTVTLLMTYTIAEVVNVGRACLQLYREAEAARSIPELEEAARHFARSMSGVGLRVLVTMAGAKLAKALPEVPKGGMGGLLSTPRYSLGGPARGRLSFSPGSSAQVSVANGTVTLMSVTANTAAAAASSALNARTSGACAESKKDDNQAHHLATDKNDILDARGGPWTPRFKKLFDQVGMSLDDPANIVYLQGHKGPHPEDYHVEVFKRLQAALMDCQDQRECQRKFLNALDEIAGDVCTPGSKLNKLATKT
ncbi:MAG TPA: AHH domain-containing protein [Archangium sp.]|uniref:AHH domain-containing protein n=1 Tax=Archangium sp. TaxID=1872627 RepID=UPI002E36DB2F|nr:AHH domain-containing protein [Archangium sp.]HEX5753598.1 AHH domain-containing protein [Archangium sp.]